MKSKKIAYILAHYPDQLETFVMNEVEGVHRAGIDVYICPIKHVPAKNHNITISKSRIIYFRLFNIPELVLAHLIFLVSKPFEYFRCLISHRLCGGKRVFLNAPFIAWRLKRYSIKHIHAHFAWTTTDLALMISRLSGIPFSFTGHAIDIYIEPVNFKEKLNESAVIVTCTKYNSDLIVARHGIQFKDKIKVIYHGVNTEKFHPLPFSGFAVDVLSIGRLMEKKGFEYLVEAIALLKKKGLDLSCWIIGDGPYKDKLTRLINDFDVNENICLKAPVKHDDLTDIYSRCKMFVLPCVIAGNGDRDGIPNVLAEAMAMGLPVISTDLPNIAELIKNKETGLLVPDKNPEKLAEAIKKLLFDKELRYALGTNARAKVANDFDAKKHVQKIADLFAQIA